MLTMAQPGLKNITIFRTNATDSTARVIFNLLATPMSMLSLNGVLELYDVRLQERGSGKEVRPIDQMSPVLQALVAHLSR